MVTKKMTEDERRSLTILYKIAPTKKKNHYMQNWSGVRSRSKITVLNNKTK